MENIRQPALAARCGEQIFRHLPVRHQRAQHRHHAAPQPDLPVAVEFLYQRIPGVFIFIERLNGRRIQPEHTCRQRAAKPRLHFRCQHGL